MIDPSFFRTKHFAIAAAVALVIVGAAAGAYAVGGRAVGDAERACEAPAVAGRALELTPATTIEDGGARRVVRYAFDAAALSAGSLDLCVSVGEVLVEPATGTLGEIEFTIVARQAIAVERTLVDVKVTDDDGRLRLAAWEEARGEATSVFDSRSAEVRLVVRVPENGAYEVRAQGDVADVRVTGLRAASLDLRTDVGSVFATGVGLEGNATASADVGNVILDLASVQSGSIVATSDVGSVEIELPRRADVGYNVTAQTGVGEVQLILGDAESSTTEDDTPGERETQRTAGFASRPTQVRVDATADVGDVRIASQA